MYVSDASSLTLLYLVIRNKKFGVREQVSRPVISKIFDEKRSLTKNGQVEKRQKQRLQQWICKEITKIARNKQNNSFQSLDLNKKVFKLGK